MPLNAEGLDLDTLLSERILKELPFDLEGLFEGSTLQVGLISFLLVRRGYLLVQVFE